MVHVSKKHRNEVIQNVSDQIETQDNSMLDERETCPQQMCLPMKYNHTMMCFPV